jgi:hypothetical protein
VHFDVKPVQPDGRTDVSDQGVDFGVARLKSEVLVTQHVGERPALHVTRAADRQPSIAGAIVFS